MKVVLFCGGLGTRIREYSESVPKPMIPIGHQPILWHVMQYYSQYGHRDFVLCLGYKANVLLIDRRGWGISGALLFWGATWALASGHPVRNAAISLALPLATFYGFYLGLGIALPAGLLQGVL